MTELEYTRLAQILGNQDRVRQWMIANEELVNGRRSKVPLPELPPVNPAQPAVDQPQITLPPRESGLAARVEQPEAEQPEIQGSLSVNPSPPPPSNLSVKGPEGPRAYDENTAILAASRRDPLSYISGMREKQLGAFDERYKALTDPTSPQYRGRSQANWFNLAAQLMKPTMSGSLVENLGGAFGYLGSEAAKRQDLLAALQERRAELAQKYDIAMLNAASDIQEKLIAAAQKSPWTGAAYDPAKGWVPRPESGLPQPVVLRGKTADGLDTEKYADGSFRVYKKDGTSQLYDAKGDPING